MPRRLDWEKARRQEQAARDRAQTQAAKGKQRSVSTRLERQLAMRAFVDKHRLVCFKCGRAEQEIAKTGISKRGPWMICTACVKGNKQGH